MARSDSSVEAVGACLSLWPAASVIRPGESRSHQDTNAPELRPQPLCDNNSKSAPPPTIYSHLRQRRQKQAREYPPSGRARRARIESFVRVIPAADRIDPVSILLSLQSRRLPMASAIR